MVARVPEPRSAYDNGLDFELWTTVVQATNNRVEVTFAMASCQRHLPGVTDEMASVISNSDGLGRLHIELHIMLYARCIVDLWTSRKPLCAAKDVTGPPCVDRLKKSRRTIGLVAVQDASYEYVTVVGLIEGNHDRPRVIRDPFSSFRRDGT